MNRIYNTFQDIGGCRGTHGSITADGLARLFYHLVIEGRIVVDVGMGTGRPVLSALVCRASKAFGYDFHENVAYTNVFAAALDKAADQWPEIENLKDRTAYFSIDIEMVGASSLFQAIFSLRILHLPSMSFGRWTHFLTGLISCLPFGTG